MVRVNSPCQPAALAASSRESTVVRAPAPPLPTIAIEMLGEAAMAIFPLIGARFAGARLQYVFKY